MMCDESADEFKLGLTHISIEFRRYEGRNTTVMQVLSSKTPDKDVQHFKKCNKSHISLQGHLTTVQLGGNPLNLEVRVVSAACKRTSYSSLRREHS